MRTKGDTCSLQAQWSLEPTGLERVKDGSERREQSCGIQSQELTWAFLGFHSPPYENTEDTVTLLLTAEGRWRECWGQELAGLCFHSCL